MHAWPHALALRLTTGTLALVAVWFVWAALAEPGSALTRNDNVPGMEFLHDLLAAARDVLDQALVAFGFVEEAPDPAPQLLEQLGYLSYCSY